MFVRGNCSVTVYYSSILTDSKDIKEEWKVEAALGLDLSHDGKLSLKLKLPDRQNNASNKSSLDNTSNKWNGRVTG